MKMYGYQWSLIVAHFQLLWSNVTTSILACWEQACPYNGMPLQRPQLRTDLSQVSLPQLTSTASHSKVLLVQLKESECRSPAWPWQLLPSPSLSSLISHTPLPWVSVSPAPASTWGTRRARRETYPPGGSLESPAPRWHQLALPGPRQLCLHGFHHKDGRRRRDAHSWLLRLRGQELHRTVVQGWQGHGEQVRQCERD